MRSANGQIPGMSTHQRLCNLETVVTNGMGEKSDWQSSTEWHFGPNEQDVLFNRVRSVPPGDDDWGPFQSAPITAGSNDLPAWCAPDVWEVLRTEFDEQVVLRAEAPSFEPQHFSDTSRNDVFSAGVGTNVSQELAVKTIQRSWKRYQQRCTTIQSKLYDNGTTCSRHMFGVTEVAKASDRGTVASDALQKTGAVVQDHNARATNNSFDPFKVGLKVQTQGLCTSTSLHGQVGVIVKAPRGSDRVGVRFGEDNSVKGIKRSNLLWDHSVQFPGTYQLDYAVIQREYIKEFQELMDQGLPGVSELTILEAIFHAGGNVSQALATLICSHVIS
jgi:hypothetical protein